MYTNPENRNIARVREKERIGEMEEKYGSSYSVWHTSSLERLEISRIMALRGARDYVSLNFYADVYEREREREYRG